MLDRARHGRAARSAIAERLLADGIAEQVATRLLAGPELQRIVQLVVASDPLHEAIGDALASPAVEQMLALALESPVFARMLAQIVDSQAVDADRRARGRRDGGAAAAAPRRCGAWSTRSSPAPRSPRRSPMQSVGFADHVAGSVRERSKHADAKLERAAWSLFRRRSRDRPVEGDPSAPGAT